MFYSFFDATPHLIIFAGLMVALLISFELGFAIGKWLRTGSDEERVVGPMVTGVLGLMAFVLALTFSMAANRQAHRMQMVLNDVNAISTAYQRSFLVNQAQGARIRDLPKKYTDVRAHFMDYEDKAATFKKIQAIQTDLWTEVITLSKTSPGAMTSLLAAALNQVSDMNELRIYGATYLRYSLPAWFVIISIVVLSMAMVGIQGGLSGKRAMVGLIPFALAMSAMVYLMADLDSPQSGWFIISQQPMLDLLKTMQ